MAQSTIPLPSSLQFPQARVAQFQRLLNTRDAAAYQVVGTLQNVLDFAEVKSFEESFPHLRALLRKFESAEIAINRFYQSQKENAL